MAQLAERLAEPAGEPPAERVGSDEAADTGALRRLAAGCAVAGAPELAPFYGALAAGQLPGGIWSYLPPMPVAMEAAPPVVEEATRASAEEDETAVATGSETAAREAQAA